MTDRRAFLKGSAAAAALLASHRYVHARGSDRLRVGVIGCGGRGTGAAVNCVDSSDGVVIHALGDLFRDRLDSSRTHLAEHVGAALDVPDERAFVGWDAVDRVLASDVDLVILATPPHFRPEHLERAVAAGKHVFMEKPVAVDPAGVRRVIAAAAAAKERRLGVVAGTQRRHQAHYLETIRRIHDGAIGGIVGGSCHWDQGGLWVKQKEDGWSDMEWQLRNWLYFTWLSGDHIVEQHIHNLDVVNWALDATPVRAIGYGGRQVRTAPEYGEIFDHHVVRYEYPGGVWITSTCRQIDGCAGNVSEHLVGTKGTSETAHTHGRIHGAHAWRFEGDAPNPYEQEHTDLIASIRAGEPLNEARRVAESTLTAIMGRMATYTGKEVTWEFAMDSRLDLTPAAYAFGEAPVPAVAVPGRTPLI